MAIYYSSLYKGPNPIRSTLYEPVGINAEHAGITYSMNFIATVPIGFTAADVMKIAPFQAGFAVAVPQIGGLRMRRLVYTTSGNAGGANTVNLGFAAAAPTAYGTALTTWQSAATTEIAVATIQAGPVLLTNDELQFVGVANTTTTLMTILGFVQFSCTIP